MESLGFHHEAGFSLKRIGRVGTLGLVMPSPRIDTAASFEVQRSRAERAIGATRQLCTWWNKNLDILRVWANIVEKSAL